MTVAANTFSDSYAMGGISKTTKIFFVFMFFVAFLVLAYARWFFLS